MANHIPAREQHCETYILTRAEKDELQRGSSVDLATRMTEHVVRTRTNYRDCVVIGMPREADKKPTEHTFTIRDPNPADRRYLFAVVRGLEVVLVGWVGRDCVFSWEGNSASRDGRSLRRLRDYPSC